MFFKNKKIIWTSVLEAINDTPEVHIKKTKDILPEWFKNIPVYDNPKARPFDRIKTVKTCPSFSEIFNEGFVMVSPTDIYINVKDDGTYFWQTPNEHIALEPHTTEQYFKYANVPNAKFILKLVSSWFCFTPKGYSLRQLPMFYEDNPDFYVPYGTIKTDQSHEINPQLIFTNKKKEIIIKQGQPLATYIPFKRSDKLEMSIEKPQKYMSKILQGRFWISGSSWRSNYHKFKDNVI
jgi:hypothetical protein